jgi:hypothetical protein
MQATCKHIGVFKTHSATKLNGNIFRPTTPGGGALSATLKFGHVRPRAIEASR